MRRIDGQGWGDHNDVVIRPSALNLTPSFLNESAFTVTLPNVNALPHSYGHRLGWKLSVESQPQLRNVSLGPNKRDNVLVVADSLLLFGDPPLQHTPNCSLDTVMCFEPGAHDIAGGQMQIPATVDHIYLAPGSWVNGGFRSTPSSQSQSITISGRGVISGSKFPFQPGVNDDDVGGRLSSLLEGCGGRATTASCEDNRTFCWALVNLDNGFNHVIEGVTLHDPPKCVSIDIMAILAYTVVVPLRAIEWLCTTIQSSIVLVRRLSKR